MVQSEARLTATRIFPHRQQNAHNPRPPPHRALHTTIVKHPPYAKTGIGSPMGSIANDTTIPIAQRMVPRGRINEAPLVGFYMAMRPCGDGCRRVFGGCFSPKAATNVVSKRRLCASLDHRNTNRGRATGPVVELTKIKIQTLRRAISEIGADARTTGEWPERLPPPPSVPLLLVRARQKRPQGRAHPRTPACCDALHRRSRPGAARGGGALSRFRRRRRSVLSGGQHVPWQGSGRETARRSTRHCAETAGKVGALRLRCAPRLCCPCPPVHHRTRSWFRNDAHALHQVANRIRYRMRPESLLLCGSLCTTGACPTSWTCKALATRPATLNGLCPTPQYNDTTSSTDFAANGAGKIMPISIYRGFPHSLAMPF